MKTSRLIGMLLVSVTVSMNSLRATPKAIKALLKAVELSILMI